MTSSPAPPSTPDAIERSWVRAAPAAMQPYLKLARADRPIGTWLLYIPCLWGLAFAAASGFPRPELIWFALLMGAGALAMRGAGCAYNDIIDQDFDARVDRTAMRPIPSGQIPTRAAWAFLAALCLVGLLVLIQFNRFTIMLAAASLALIGAYPFMKRITYWPQAWLGLTFNWGALVGYAAAAGELAPAAFAVYGAGFFWTLGYDTIYAHQDKEDDALIGVKSTALKFGATTWRWLVAFYAVTLGGFCLAGFLIGAGVFYYLALFPAAAHFIWQVKTLDIDDFHSCLSRFKSNRDAGLLLLLAPICELAARSL